MVLKNLKIVTLKKVIENGYIVIENKKIKKIGIGNYDGEAIDCKGKIAMPGFIDIHIHGSVGIDFMDAKVEDYETIANALYTEGTTTFLATTLTSDHKSLLKVCRTVAKAKKNVPSLGGIHLEGPYINAKYKGAQNEAFIRLPNINEMEELIKASHKNVRYISMAPENEGSIDFIKYCVANNVTVSAGHSDATFNDVEKAIEAGLTNTTHTHNAMSGHHHRKPGIVTASFYFDELFSEFICDRIHVCDESLKTSYKIVGADRFMIVTDALLAKHSTVKTFKLFGLDCENRDGAAYLTTGPLAGSLLNMDQGIRNIHDLTGASLIDLAKISSYNQARSMHFTDRGELKAHKLADIVLMDETLHIQDVYKEGKKVI